MLEILRGHGGWISGPIPENPGPMDTLAIFSYTFFLGQSEKNSQKIQELNPISKVFTRV